MDSAAPDVRVRLSAEGVAEVAAAFRTIAQEGAKSGAKATQAFDQTNKSLASLRSTVATLKLAVVWAGIERGVHAVLDFAESLRSTADNLGISTDLLQELRYAAVQTGTPIDVLERGLAALSQRIGDAAAKGEPVVAFLDGTAIAAKNADGSVRDLWPVLNDVATKFPALASAAERAAAAQDLFGKSGRSMIGMMADGAEGLGVLRQQAHTTAYVMGSELVQKAALVSDHLAAMKTEFLVAFGEGFLGKTLGDAQGLADVFKDPDFQHGVEDIASGFKYLGSALALIIELIGKNPQLFEVLAGFAIGARVGGVGGAAVGGGIGTLVAAAQLLQASRGSAAPEIPPLLRRPPEGSDTASGIISDESKAIAALQKQAADAQNDISARRARIIEEVAAGQTSELEGDQQLLSLQRERLSTLEDIAAKVRAIADRSQNPQDLATASSLEKQVSQARIEAAQAAKQMATDAGQEAHVREQAARAAEEYEARLLEMQGQRHAAEQLALNVDLMKYEENLRKMGTLNDAAIAERVAKARAAGEQRITFADLQAEADKTFGEIDARRTAITEAVALGQITEQQGEAQLIALDKERLAGLEAVAAKMLAIAEASGDQKQIDAARQLVASISGLRIETDKAGREWAAFQKQMLDAGQQSAANFFDDFLSGAKSADQAFSDLTKSIRAAFFRLISEQLAQKLFSSLFGAASGGGFLGFFGIGTTPAAKARGGIVRGPGTATSDSVPAWLSDGEFVVRAGVVGHPGVRAYLEQINAGMNLPRIAPDRYRGFNAGGYVSSLPQSVHSSGSRSVVLQVTPDVMGMTLGDWFSQYLATEASKL